MVYDVLMSQTFRFSPKPNKAHLIHWREWSGETFQKAQDEDKPAYLSLSAVWCHWCHVFDETTLSDPEVIDVLNNDFICIRVDADKNPHIQSRYLAGGWPTSAFLTPKGDIIVAGTYIYPNDFKSLAKKVSEYHKNNKGELYARIARIKVERGIEKESQPVTKEGLTDDIPKKVLSFIKEFFDPIHGGFGAEPKFPQPEVIEFLIKESLLGFPGEETHATEALEMAKKSLDGMLNGELWDRVEKGFFRYCTKADWTIPHFEKMLEGNAGLLKDYLLGYQTTCNESYRSAAEGIIHYTNTHLLSPTGGFYGSQDADEEYYRLDADGRCKATAPKIDECIYIDWDGQMISQYLTAYQCLASEETLERALRSLSFLREKAYKKGHGMCHYITDGEARHRGLLADQLYTIEALLSAYQITSKSEYLSWATDLMDYITHNLADRTGGGFFDVPGELASAEKLAFREKPFRENSVAARVLIRLSYLTGEEKYKKEALNTLLAFVHTFEDYSLQAALFAMAVREYLSYPVHIVIVGKKSAPDTEALHREALRVSPRQKTTRPIHPSYEVYTGALSWKIVQVLDPTTDSLELGPITFPKKESASAYICKEGSCSPPITDPAEISKILMQA